MDLKKERQIKFWLTTISKVLIIALVLFKLVDVVFSKDQEDSAEEGSVNNSLQNAQDLDTIATNRLKTDTQEIIRPEIKKDTSDIGESDLTKGLQKKDTKKEETKSTTNAKTNYAEVQLKEKGFVWLQESKKAVLQILNPTAVKAINIKATATLVYGNQALSVNFPERTHIGSNETMTLEASLKNLPQKELPTRIMLCITHGTSNLEKKTAYSYILGNRISGSGAIEIRSYVYGVTSESKSFYTNRPPNCNIISQPSTKPTTNIVSTSKKSTEENTEYLEKIKSTAQLFLNGLNNKSLITIKSVSSQRLYKHIANGDYKNYAYGFNSQIEIQSSNASKASIKISLTEKGRANYINQQTLYESNNSGKNVRNLFDFLQREGGGWKAVLINQNGLWKFDLP